MRYLLLRTTVLSLLAGSIIHAAERRVLDAKMHHLRRAGPREWSEFPATAEAAAHELKFSAQGNESEQALRIRQQDVKQPWHVSLNGKELGQLRIDENDLVLYFAVPPGTLLGGENRLLITQRGTIADDIRLGEIELDPRPVDTALSVTMLDVEVRDVQTQELIPARMTILTEHGSLQTVGARSDNHLAIRPGIVYTADGRARFGLPAGRYTVFAGRGFEYSLASAAVVLQPGDNARQSLVLRREVPTGGYVACDTHVHTLTHSGHGDATIEERMITIAGEGIELPIATDHNVHIDYEATARALQVRPYFTPVIGNEVTTSVGHFNVFPVEAGARTPNAKLTDWRLLFDDIYGTPGVKGVILNHARDLHGGTRPFGPALHNTVVGENLEGWTLRANAMEVVNSGATQTNVRQLLHDWMAMLNRGRMLTPVGASDSHDVGRHFIGQGRTYIRACDDDPGTIDIEEAVANFVQGRVMVSYGLLAELTVDRKYGPGELAPLYDETVQVAVRVLGPHWVQADSVELYANGKKIREYKIVSPADSATGRGIKWSGQWELPRPEHDVHLVAMAIGPGVDGLYWKTAKPYQPQSPDWEPHVVGCSGAVWLDADRDGRRTPAFDYAQRFVGQARDLPSLLDQLSRFDEAVAAQAAHLWQQRGNSLFNDDSQTMLMKASPAVRAGFQAYLEAHRETEKARVEAGKK